MLLETNEKSARRNIRRINDAVNEYGPKAVSEAFGNSLPDIAWGVTGIEPFRYNEDIIDKTNNAASKYLESGLAVSEFPTFYHRVQIESRKREIESRNKYRDALEEAHKQILQGRLNESQIKYIRLLEGVVHSENKRWDIEKELKSWIREGIGLYGVLMGQYEEDGKIVEVYSNGGYQLNAKVHVGHTYDVFEYDPETGERLNAPKFGKKLINIAGGIINLGTLTFFGAIKDITYNKLINRRIQRKTLDKIQENWENRNH